MGARAAARRTPPAPTVARYQLSAAVSRPGFDMSATLRRSRPGPACSALRFGEAVARQPLLGDPLGLVEEHVPAHLLLLEAAGGEERRRVADRDRAQPLDPVGDERRDEPRDRRAPVVADDRGLLDARARRARRPRPSRGSGPRTRRRPPARRTRGSRAGRARSCGSPAAVERGDLVPPDVAPSRGSRGGAGPGGRPPGPRP